MLQWACMRHTRSLPGCLIVLLVSVIALSILFSAPPAEAPAPARAGAALATQWAAALETPPGAAFELSATPAEWAGWLNGQIADPDAAALAGIFVRAETEQIQLTARVRGLLLVPTQLVVGLRAQPAADGPHFTCTDLRVGRLRLPAGVYPWVSRQWDAAWQQWVRDWHLDQVEWDAARIRIAGQRR